MKQVINIDGIPGSGVSSQINLLNRYFKDLGVDLLIQRIIDSTTYCGAVAQINYDFNHKNTQVALNTGSLGSLIARKVLNGSQMSDLGLEQEIYLHECLAHLYKITNIVLVPEKVDFCIDRLKQVNKLRNIEINTEDPSYYEKYLQILNNLNSLMLTINLKFTIIEVRERDSILDIHKKIMEKIGAN
jgi:hypothetical protein